MTVHRRFTFVLIPRFSLLAVSCALDALRAANIGTEDDTYEWQLAGVDGGTVPSSCGVPLPVMPLGELQNSNVIAVCGGDSSHNYESTELTRWLRAQAQRDISIGAISDGSFVAAAAGLFYGHRSTIHWKCQDAYRSRYPDLDIRASILEFDRRRFSCAGGTASLDLALHFIREDLGDDAMIKITDNYFHDTVRDNNQGQHMAEAYRHANRSRVLADALAIMTANLDRNLSIAEISDRVGTSHRSLDRLFRKHLDATPGQHFRNLRLSRASALLVQTSLPVSEIALSCGFATASHLGRYFRDAYTMTPKQYRQRKLERSRPVP